jgi:hypothetical protein
VQLLAQMGGAPPGGAFVLGCCFVFPLLPLVAVLAGAAVHRNAAWLAVLALILAGLPSLALLTESDAWDPVPNSKLVAGYLLLVAVAVFSLCWVIAVRLLGPPRDSAPEGSGVPPASSDWGRLWGWLRRRSGWLAVLAAILALMAMLPR